MQSIPLAVLKQFSWNLGYSAEVLHAIHTACGIETATNAPPMIFRRNCMQSIPLAVLKHFPFRECDLSALVLHAIHTACGIFLFLARFFQTCAFFMA